MARQNAAEWMKSILALVPCQRLSPASAYENLLRKFLRSIPRQPWRASDNKRSGCTPLAHSAANRPAVYASVMQRRQIVGIVVIVLVLLALILWRFAVGSAWRQF